MDGMSHISCDSDTLNIHKHGEDVPEDCLRLTQQDLQNKRPNSRPNMSFDQDSRPSVIETANKAPHVIECT